VYEDFFELTTPRAEHVYVHAHTHVPLMTACASCRRELLYSCDVERKGIGQVSLLLDVILCHLLYALYYNTT
jgi:hypothetical protein